MLSFFVGYFNVDADIEITLLFLGRYFTVDS